MLCFRATGVPPVLEHGRDGRGTSLVAASPRCMYSNGKCSSFFNLLHYDQVERARLHRNIHHVGKIDVLYL